MSLQPSPVASLIISVYKNIPYLESVLRSADRQTFNQFEIIISEDGDSKEMSDFVKGYPFQHPWMHLQQEDKGWQKNKALNRAIQAARTEYLVFLDGDCVMHPRFMEMHVRYAQKGVVLGGKRLKMNDILSEKVLSGEWEDRHIVRYLLRHFHHPKKCMMRYPEEGFFLAPNGLLGWLTRFRKIKSLTGCNMSIHKADFVAVNGFDEDYVRPAVGEDADPTWRFRMAGYPIKSVRNLAVQYHFKHPENWTDQEENQQMMEEKKKTGNFRCLNGIEKR